VRDVEARELEVKDGPRLEGAVDARFEHVALTRGSGTNARGGAGVQDEEGPLDLHREPPPPRNGRIALWLTSTGPKDERKDSVESLEVVCRAGRDRRAAVEVKNARTSCVNTIEGVTAMPRTNKVDVGRTPSLQRFTLEELAPFTKEGVFASNASQDFHLFYVGRDDVHGVLRYLLSRASTSLYLNMFGYDDEELNAECMRCAGDRSMTTVITLDKSQSGGKHEKAILDSDLAKDPAAFNAHFVVGQSATHQISHTKGGVLDGRVGFEGSTNWSASGEGTFVVRGQPGGPGYKAQNNTLAVFTDPDTIARFTAELVAEHLAARGAGLSRRRAQRRSH
jgi:hypothetical protein